MPCQYLSLNHKDNLCHLDWRFGSWMFLGTQRNPVCICKSSAEKCAIVSSLTRTYELNQNTRYTVQAFKFSVSFRATCSRYYGPSSFSSVFCKAQTLMEMHLSSGISLFAFMTVAYQRGFYKIKLAATFPAILCVLWGRGSPANAQMPWSLASVCSNVLCAILCELTWSVGHEILSDTASLTLQDWVTSGSLLLMNGHKSHPARGGTIKLKFCQLEADLETNSLASKETCQQSSSQSSKVDFPTTDVGLSWGWDSEWSGVSCPLFLFRWSTALCSDPVCS